MKFNGIGFLAAMLIFVGGSVAGTSAAAVGTDANSVSASTRSSVKSSISFAGTSVPVIKGNMNITTAPKGNVAETWGGQTTLSVSDNQSTHIIGHDGTRFGEITKLKKGSPVKVVDVHGQTKTYHVTQVSNVTDYGLLQGTKTDVWNKIVNAKQGEQVVLQTCLSETLNRVVWAR
ncbi:sortase [Lacticaseibacillus pabuli]|uniref:Sortase n=1 Tax=Lacticaseibacillus pabuli TaxID=3025672 RepID=A0ABY7WT96_9LACO|nr:sortase [Lacticaseibacillus sp. KACC 23028]WDF82976.1 sortase [Lacticaseibacillus sp. KACC 23028]